MRVCHNKSKSPQGGIPLPSLTAWAQFARCCSLATGVTDKVGFLAGGLPQVERRRADLRDSSRPLDVH